MSSITPAADAVIARPAGQPRSRIEIGAGEDRTWRVDCLPAMRGAEWPVRVVSAAAPGFSVCEGRVREGRFVLLRLGGHGGASAVGPVELLVETTAGRVSIKLDVQMHAR